MLASYDRNLRSEGARWIVFSFPSGNLWPATRQPALLVWGTAPGFSSYEDAEDFVLARPDAQLVLLRDAALLPNEERSEAFDDVLIGYLDRTGLGPTRVSDGGQGSLGTQGPSEPAGTTPIPSVRR